MNTKTLQFIFILGFIILKSQVGVNTSNPQATLDINGNLRIQKTDISSNASDGTLVVDNTGVVKKSLKGSKGIMRGYLNADFNTPQVASTIYKLVNFQVVDNPNSDFSASTSVFTAPVSGIYRVVYTTTIQMNGDNPNTNTVVGIADGSTNRWICRNSILKTNTTTATVGAAYSFVNLVQLNAGQTCYFGATGYTRTLAMPTGGSGTGTGTFFEIQLINNN